VRPSRTNEQERDLATLVAWDDLSLVQAAQVLGIRPEAARTAPWSGGAWTGLPAGTVVSSTKVVQSSTVPDVSTTP
jgi:hypothetical protein